jgi:hypothetical protein
MSSSTLRGDSALYRTVLVVTGPYFPVFLQLYEGLNSGLAFYTVSRTPSRPNVSHAVAR